MPCGRSSLRARRIAIVAGETAALGAEAGDRRNFAGFPVDPANRMIFRVDNKGIARLVDRDAFRAIERRVRRRAAVAGEALFARAGDVFPVAGRQIDLPDAMPFAQRRPERLAGDEQRPRTDDRLAARRFASDGNFVSPVPAIVSMLPLAIDTANAVVADVGDVQNPIPCRIAKGDAVRLLELRFRRRSTIAGKARFAGAGDRGDVLVLASMRRTM